MGINEFFLNLSSAKKRLYLDILEIPKCRNLATGVQSKQNRLTIKSTVCQNSLKIIVCGDSLKITVCRDSDRGTDTVCGVWTLSK